MLKYENGEYKKMTAEEIAALDIQEEPTTEPTMEERLEALESAMLEQILNDKGVYSSG